KRTSSRSAAFSCSRRIFAQASSSSAGRLGRPGRRPRGTFSVTTPRGSSTSTSRSPAPVASGAAAPVFASVAIFEPSCKGVERRRGRGTAAARGAYRLAVRTRKLPLPAGRRKFRDPLPRVRGGWKRQKGRASVMRVRILASGLALLLAACGRGPAPAAPTPAAVAEPDTVRRDIRWAARPVPVPPSFQRAVDEGTRTLDGRPGPAYWQQRVVYRIDAELDPGTGRLQAEERVTYHNRSPDTLHVVVFNLYQNLFRAGAPRNEPVPVTDGLVLERFAIAGAEADPIDIDAEAPPDRATYHLDGTLLVAHLPRPLAPGDSVEFQVAWHFTVPPADAPRTGRSDHAVYQVAQWYPQIAVYDDLRGWNADPYLGTGEFYLEYGDFDVAITVPEGWLVAATGTLENPDEVLTDMARDRLGLALRSDSVVQVVSVDDRDAGNATQRVPGGQLTWRFQARDVRDFAFAASDRYVWDATR